MRIALLTGIFGLLFFLRLGAVGAVDYDEAVYAEVSRGMYLNGQYLDPVQGNEPFYEKPPLLYWTQVLGYHVFGVGEWGLRFFNALAGVLTVLLVYLLARRPLGEEVAFLAAWILGSSLQMLVISRLALTDGLLTLWLTATVGSLHRALEHVREGSGRGAGWFFAACLSAGLAMLTKGAIGFLLPAGAVFFFLLQTRRFGVLRKVSWLLPGMVLLFGVGFSWYLALGFTHPEGFTFMRELFLQHHVGRFTQPMQGHGGPVYYYLLVILGGFLPWSPLLVVALCTGEFRRHSLLQLFSWFALLTLVFFSIAATKLPNYITPCLPACALLVASAAQRGSRPGLWNAMTRVTAGLFLLVGVLVAALPWIQEQLPAWMGDRAGKVPGLGEAAELGYSPYLTGGVLIVATVLLLARRELRTPVVAPWSLGIPVLVFSLLVASDLLPRLDRHFLRPLRHMGSLAAAAVPPGQEIVLLGLRRRPSVVFYQGRPTRYVSKDDAGSLFHAAEVGLTTRLHLPQLEAAGTVELLGEEHGYVAFRTRP